MTDIFQPFTTPRLILRCPESGDAEAFSRLTTPGIARWLANWPYPFTIAMAEERIKNVRTRAAERKGVPLAVIRKSNACFMGYMGIFVTSPGRAALGYWLGGQFHGLGYMREAAPVAVRAGFDMLDVQAIESGAQLANTASFAVMRACGMTYVGDRLTFSPTRGLEEMCSYYEARRD